MKRRDAREAAMLLIFEKSFREESMQEIIEDAVDSRALELDDYSKSLVLKSEDNAEDIDYYIEKYLDKWKLNRLPRVTLSVLRLAICELRYFEDIPV